MTLKEIVKNIYKAGEQGYQCTCGSFDKTHNCYIDDKVSQIKQWAKKKVPEEEKVEKYPYKGKEIEIAEDIFTGFNACRNETLGNIDEST